jgi:glycine/D-amino acid oxidase-like deaminating enzyme
VGALYTPSDGLAHPLKTTLAFAEAARRLGAHIRPYCPVEGLITGGGAVKGVVTERGEVLGKTVICAAGIHSRKLARMAGLDLPMRAVRNTVAATPPMPHLTSLAVFGKDVCFRQTREGHVYMAITSKGAADFDVTLESFRHIPLFLPTFLANREMLRIHVGKPLLMDVLRAMPWSAARKHPFAHTIDSEPRPNLKTVEKSRRALMDHFPSRGEILIERSWAGITDSMPDLLPVLGPTAAVDGFVFATGSSGHGFGMGPPVGFLLSEWIVDGKPSIDLHGMRYERFQEGDLGEPRKIG